MPAMFASDKSVIIMRAGRNVIIINNLSPVQRMLREPQKDISAAIGFYDRHDIARQKPNICYNDPIDLSSPLTVT